MTGRTIDNPLVTSSRTLVRGSLVDVEEDRWIVSLDCGGTRHAIVADVLVASSNPVVLSAGDEVLCWVDRDLAQRGVIVGRIGGIAAVESEKESEIADSLVLQANRSITLRVGDGSITIREDGKILIKGTDLVSHAKRMNRVRGGAVAIN